MDETPNLGLPYIMAAQSQKHVTHNEAIRALDAIVQLAVLDRDLAAPPGSPAEGARYIVAASPTGAWSGHAGDVAAYQDGAWVFYEPVEGFIAWIADEDVAVVWSGSAWTALTTGGGGGGGSGSFTTLGINATADTSNRLALAADATLLNHDGDGHQLKINKASASDTASLLYQDAFSGRAELGLAGDDDFHFKVSADGSTWKEAILINRSTGAVTFPFTALGGGAVRELLTGNRTYYARSDGSNSNNGLANTSGGAFLTLQKAIDTVATLDLSIFRVVIKIGAAGTYAGCTISAPFVGGPGSYVEIDGDTGSPGSYVISSDVVAQNYAALRVKGVDFTSSGNGLNASAGAVINVTGAVIFGACASGSHMIAQQGGKIVVSANYTIDGDAVIHIQCRENAFVFAAALTVTISGSRSFNYVTYFNAAVAQLNNNTYVGTSVTGQRYNVTLNGVVFVNGASTTYLPGSAGGATATGGQYA